MAGLMGPPVAPPPPPDVFYGGVSSLADQLDKLVMIVLRDGRHLVGKLTSYDQYGSLVLEDSRERHFAGGKYADVPMGLFILRGENVVLLCEIDPSRESGGRSGPVLQQADWEEVHRLEEDEGTAGPSTARQAASWAMSDKASAEQ